MSQRAVQLIRIVFFRREPEIPTDAMGIETAKVPQD
jgi:hypothetical protein